MGKLTLTEIKAEAQRKADNKNNSPKMNPSSKIVTATKEKKVFRTQKNVYFADKDIFSFLTQKQKEMENLVGRQIGLGSILEKIIRDSKEFKDYHK